MLLQTLTQRLQYLTATFKPKPVQPEKKRLSRKDKAKEKERVRELMSRMA